MQHVLWEVRSLLVKHDSADQLEAVIGHLEDVEAIHVLGKFLARMVEEI
jgi:predicted Zn-dependent protease